MQSCCTWINCVWVVTLLSPRACVLIKQNIWRGGEHTAESIRRDPPFIQSVLESELHLHLGCAYLFGPKLFKNDKQPIPALTELFILAQKIQRRLFNVWGASWGMRTEAPFFDMLLHCLSTWSGLYNNTDLCPNYYVYWWIKMNWSDSFFNKVLCYIISWNVRWPTIFYIISLYIKCLYFFEFF